MNFARDVVGAAALDRLALIELDRAGGRRVWTFGEVGEAAARFAGRLREAGVAKGDVVLTSIGNRPEWALTMLACFRLGAIVAPCPEQLRAKDLGLRIKAAAPAVIVADERNRAELMPAAGETPVLWIQDERLWQAAPSDAVEELAPHDPCLVTFTSGTSGMPKAVLHLQRYLTGQALQAKHWMGLRPGDVAWCTASSGWSKSARNGFVAAWLRGGTAILHDGRFDADERLSIVTRERVSTLCMAPTEYRMIVKRARVSHIDGLRNCVAAGEALDPAVIEAWRDATGTVIRDGYGQTETGQLTGFAPGDTVRPGSMGRALPGVDLWLERDELVVSPRSVPTFFRGYLGAEPVSLDEPWHTGDRVVLDDEGLLRFVGRADDIIVSAGYRIGPFEVESALVGHNAVEEAAAVPAPDDERGSIVRAVIVLRDGYTPSERLKRDLQEHVKAETAPYKYPRQIDFVERLPKTASGKIQRARLRKG